MLLRLLLCSVLLLEYGLKPLVHLLLTAVVGGASAGAISSALVGLYHLLWLAPAYLVSLLVNCIWCVWKGARQDRRGGLEGSGTATQDLSLSGPPLAWPLRSSLTGATLPSPSLTHSLRRYSEIAELVVVAGQRRALQQRAQRQGVMLVAAQQGGAVLKVGSQLPEQLGRPALAPSACPVPLLPCAVTSTTTTSARYQPPPWYCRCTALMPWPSSPRRCTARRCWPSSLHRSHWRGRCPRLVGGDGWVGGEARSVVACGQAAWGSGRSVVSLPGGCCWLRVHRLASQCSLPRPPSPPAAGRPPPQLPAAQLPVRPVLLRLQVEPAQRAAAAAHCIL